MNKKYNFCVYIGRFEPFHLGHAHVVENALKLADKLIIIVGSHNKPIDWKNPWTSDERIQMIKASLSEEQKNNIYFQVVEDHLYQDSEWEASIYEAVDSVLHEYSKYRVSGHDDLHTAKICVVGFDKDESSFYLKSFPQWKLELINGYGKPDKDAFLNATMIRDMLYHNRFDYVKELVPTGTYDYIKQWLPSDSAAYVKDWYDKDFDYQQPYEDLPYGTNFYCADSVVLQSGYVLMIKRKDHPGKGLWALPGGHVMLNESAEKASLRELKEETCIKVPDKVLAGSLVSRNIFDHPERSLRGRCGKVIGRTVSNAFFYHLQGNNELPRVTAADDAAEVWFFNLLELRKMKNQIFEDHLSIIEYFISRV